ncbi:M10 family metallopeptidase C-terminal domain-containing protein [Caulobacter sp. NIBR2454]|uniref:M10 family metallopeptidase C-terminal domain-containing protein n=1 Tax=Caulobacter sp. NIBR2454 TaxID=3015996 RepID=UPI0022B69BA0|nr:M10 family metallopeptidase C-terminal domain-containing protein [Caulobacter sp. NIBR2454]
MGVAVTGAGHGHIDRNHLYGGAGADTFVYAAITGSNHFQWYDNIFDFVSGVDRIDVSALDARSNVSGNQAFTFLGTAAFTGVSGQLRYVVSGANVGFEADVKGDGLGDFRVLLLGVSSLTAADFVL